MRRWNPSQSPSGKLDGNVWKRWILSRGVMLTIDRTSRANSLAGGQADTRSAHLTTVSILFLRMVDRYLMPQGGER